MKQTKILVALFCIAIGFIVNIIGYAQDEGEGAKKESPNDYYKNEEFKAIVDNIIKNYGGAEAIKSIKHCQSNTAATYSSNHGSCLLETGLFCAITDTEPALMKYRREDYVSSPDTAKYLASGFIFNGQEVIPLLKDKTIAPELGRIVNRFFDARYLFPGAFNIRLSDENYSVAYKGKQKNKELGKDVYAVELKDVDPETLKNRTLTLYYNTATYLLEALYSDDEYELPASTLPPGVAGQVPTYQGSLLILIKEHRSYEVKVNDKKQGVKCISKLSVKRWQITGDPKKDMPPKEGTSVDVKTSFSKFKENIFDKKQ